MRYFTRVAIGGGGWGKCHNIALRFPNRIDMHISTQLLLLCYKQDRLLDIVRYWRGVSRELSKPPRIALVSMTKLVTTVTEVKESDVNTTDCTVLQIGSPILHNHTRVGCGS